MCARIHTHTSVVPRAAGVDAAAASKELRRAATAVVFGCRGATRDGGSGAGSDSTGVTGMTGAVTGMTGVTGVTGAVTLKPMEVRRGAEPPTVLATDVENAADRANAVANAEAEEESTAQHSTPQHSTPQHSTTQHTTAQHTTVQ